MDNPGPHLEMLSVSPDPVRLKRDHPDKEEAMKYMLLIHQGDTPTPRDPKAWGRLSPEAQQSVYQDYKAVTSTPGVKPRSGCPGVMLPHCRKRLSCSMDTP